MLPTDFICHERCAPTQPASVALPVYWKDAVLPAPTRTGVEAQKQAVIRRVGKKTPDIQPLDLGAFRYHNRLQCRRRLSKEALAPDADVCSFGAFMEWLDNTHYSGPRKKQLIQLRLEMPDNPTERQLMKAAFNKCFVKPEGYLLYKPGRGIMSRSDFIKCWIGPLIKKCENMVYDMPEFIKHVKCHDRSALSVIICRGRVAYMLRRTIRVLRAQCVIRL